MSPALCLAALLAILAAPAACEVTNVALLAANGAEQPERVGPRPRARPEGERRCTADGRLCIRADNYVEDVCRVIEEAAGAEGLDVTFFARLLWRESLFDASAVSPAGAQGIAQFMPGTAALRGLRDPFNPAEAILASAGYLRELERRFGSLGLAAVAYNAGEERAERFLAGSPFLPGETRAYVAAITGVPAEAWRDGAARDGTLPAPDLSLDPGLPFGEACLARAASRAMPSFEPPEPVLQRWRGRRAARTTERAWRRRDRLPRR